MKNYEKVERFYERLESHDRYEELISYFKKNPEVELNKKLKNPQKKVKKWLDTEGAEDINLLNLWDMFLKRKPIAGPITVAPPTPSAVNNTIYSCFSNIP